MGLENMVQSLESYGVSDVLLPFILVFTIVYAVMQKTKLLGDGKKQFNVIISLVLAFSVVIPHVLGKYPRNADIVDIMNKALPQVSIVIVAIVMVLIILGVFGTNINLAGATLGGWFALIAILSVIFIFGSAAGWGWLQFGFLRRIDSDLKNLIVIILVFGVIIHFITKETPGDKTEGFFRKGGNLLKELLAGK